MGFTVCASLIFMVFSVFSYNTMNAMIPLLVLQCVALIYYCTLLCGVIVCVAVEVVYMLVQLQQFRLFILTDTGCMHVVVEDSWFISL